MSTLFPCIDKSDFGGGADDSDSPGLDSTFTSEDEDEEDDLDSCNDNCSIPPGGSSASPCNTKKKPRRRLRRTRESVYDEQTLFNESREESTFLRVEDSNAQECRTNSRFETMAIHNGPHCRRSLNEFNRDSSPTAKTTTTTVSRTASGKQDASPTPSLFPPIMAVQFDFESGGIPLQPDYSIDPAELGQ
ncbi:hypothetical protein TRVA0_022S00518 [Trichomonascus vanleenenianus]|uniref:uncharacterized protein n=1 Tax=Trichomonascus vanleenenianus TaxID=2268995 RepID=UPI003ECA49F4